ncbi:hypothetical protein P9A16_07145 [Shinella sp. 838]|uniref:hypothetical protein n=1 Tax=Shinella sp. 838 TaxID=3038164 RepID=UPI002414FB95|nr:hypothetical protein [Shinella sp. 838]MDG4670893.1 hypothetical protein [Shinella sp. 838]
MTADEIQAEIEAFDRSARALFGLEDGDDWQHFTSESEHPDLYRQRRRLERNLALAEAATRLVPPRPRGS